MQIGSFSVSRGLTFGNSEKRFMSGFQTKAPTILKSYVPEKPTTVAPILQKEELSVEDQKALFTGLKIFLKRRFAKGEEAKKIAQRLGIPNLTSYDRTVQQILKLRGEIDPLKKDKLALSINPRVSVDSKVFKPIEASSKNILLAFARVAQFLSNKTLNVTYAIIGGDNHVPSNLWNEQIEKKVPDLLELGRKILAKRQNKV